VLYLKTLDAPPVYLKTVRATSLYLTPSFNTYFTVLPKGQTVELLGIGPRQLQIRGRMSSGPAQGWVSRADCTPVPDDLIRQLLEQKQKSERLDSAMARKEVILGMTTEQVRKVLGRPTDVTHIQEEGREVEVWTYYSFRTVPVTENYPDGNGVWQTRSYTTKVRTGSKTLYFKDDALARIEDKQENENLPVPAPYGYPGSPYGYGGGSGYPYPQKSPFTPTPSPTPTPAPAPTPKPPSRILRTNSWSP